MSRTQKEELIQNRVKGSGNYLLKTSTATDFSDCPGSLR
jgi:hypothetical protein